jgi:hypothetical protein
MPFFKCHRVERSRHLLAALVAFLQRLDGDGERRLQMLEIIGELAWLYHGGIFALPRLEAILRDDPSFVGSAPTSSAAECVRGRTLHVLTEGYSVGGHTRLVRRWIELMGNDRHAVVLSRQRLALNPGYLLPPDADVPLLDLEQMGVLRLKDKVAHLMELFRQADRVVLHIHPDDACAVAAAYRVRGLDLCFLNHADHTFWLGAGLPARFLNLRTRGTRLAVTRRGISEAACAVVPLPISPAPPLDRAEARERLGIGADEVLLLTVASGYKFNPVEGRSLLPMLDAVLARPEVRLIGIGISDGHPVFSALVEHHSEKVRVFGAIPSPDLHRAAADIYLDSFPFCSPTSLLESAAIGTPTAAYQPDADELEILYSECPGLPRKFSAAEDPEGYVELLETLVADANLRRDLSESIRVGMAAHLPEAWKHAVAAFQASSFEQHPWQGKHLPVLDGLLDRSLAGLGHDPQGFDLTRCSLDRWSRLRIRIETKVGRI